MDWKTKIKGLLSAYESKHRLLVAAGTAADGSQWYRKYADGFIIQGGTGISGTYSSPVTVTYPLAFTAVPPTLIGTVVQIGGNNYAGVYFKDATATSFGSCGYRNGDSVAREYTWFAAGY